MAIDEQYLRVRRSLEEKLGVEEASYLMDRPVGGWSELVTNHTLDLKFAVVDERLAALEARFDARFEAMEARFDARFEAMEARFDARFEAMDATFDAKLDAFRHELFAQMHHELRDQTWKMLTAVIAGMGVMGAVFGALVVLFNA